MGQARSSGCRGEGPSSACARLGPPWCQPAHLQFLTEDCLAKAATEAEVMPCLRVRTLVVS